jgi:lysophospholipase L1-like esterase
VSGTGANGDFYLDTLTNCLYGPKASGSWPGTCTAFGATLSASTSNLVAQYVLNEGTGGYAYNYAFPPEPNYNMIGPSEQQFNTSTSNGPVPWTAPGMTLTDAYAANPNGDFIASRLQAVGTGGYLTTAKQPPFVSGRQYTISIYAASNTGVAQTFRMSDNNVNYGSNIAVPATGWARYSYTFTSTSTGNGYAIPVAQDAANDHLDLLIWGAQLEVGPHPTSYFNPSYTMVNGAGPQQTASACSWVTAGIDCTTVCASNYCGWMQATGWQPVDMSAVTAYAAVKSTTSEALAGYAPIVNDNYLSNPQFWLAGQVNGTLFPSLRFGPSIGYAYAASVLDGNWHILAGEYDGSNNIYLYIDGYLAQTWAVGGLAPIQFNQLFISNFGGAGFWPGQIGYVAIYRVAHSQAQILGNTAAVQSIMATRGVAIPSLKKAMVFEGDSITDPNVSMGANLKYSALAQAAITPFPQGSNFAISGSGIANISARSAAVDAAFATTSLAEKLLFLFDGANDSGLGAATLVADLKAYCLARKAASPGLKIVIATLLPQTTAGFNTFRDAVNPLIKADSSWYDAIADFAANGTMGCDACAANTTYFSDGEHPTAAGQALLGPIAQAAIQSVW